MVISEDGKSFLKTVGFVIAVFLIILLAIYAKTEEKERWCIEEGYDCYGAGYAFEHDKCGYLVKYREEPWIKPTCEINKG